MEWNKLKKSIYFRIMDNYQPFFEANKDLWNQRTVVHKNSTFYDLEGFKSGKTVLTPIELNEIGEVASKKMLHLQCHFGMDSLNWARLGADVTGVDLSDIAIHEARQLNQELGLNARFICSNIYDLKNELLEQYDIVFTSYGTIGWLPDLDKWAELISFYLKKGGLFYMADFHPVLWMFDDEFKSIRYSYENSELITVESNGTYTDREAAIKAKEFSWNHSISEILNALLRHGLELKMFNEYMYSPYPCFANSTETQKGQWQINGLEGKIPMVYSIRAIKQ